MTPATNRSLVLPAVLAFSLLPCPVYGQQVAPAPLPPVEYASLTTQDEGAGEHAAEAKADTQGKGKEKEDDLAFLEKPLSEISRTQVTSPALSATIDTVSRTTQPLARTPAAVYVVTNEMIRRSGARNIPEVLRTVPGVNVARINASAWAISIRGLNGRFAKDLLVQIDGVAIYSPTHSGVFWERNYVMLEDVERIEVIRGPGAAVWGVNAVNGVINIVTKSSQDTRGLFATGGGGNEHREFGDFRVGGRSGNLSWRTYGMTMEDDQGYVTPPFSANDEPRMDQGGFRADWAPTRVDTITIQGDFYHGQDNQEGWSYPPFFTAQPMDCNTNTFLTRWSRTLDEDTDWAVQFYYYNPYAIGANVNQVGTFDFDYQYHLKRGRHDVVWGLGYRNSDEGWCGESVAVRCRDSEQIPSYFVQDTITLVEDRFFATFGSKFDHNSVTHFEYQPTARVTWTPDERTSVWGAISRAARTPSLIERVYRVPKGEHVLAYELGVRRQPTDRFYWELATFFNRYNQLLGSYAYDTYYAYANEGRADTYGFELNGTYEITKRWRLTAWYALVVQDVDFVPGYTPTFVVEGTPRNQAYFQSAWDLGRNVDLDVTFRYVDGIVLASAYPVDSYFVADIRLAWQATRTLEFSVVGQNLLAGNHYEFTYDGGSLPTEVEPGVYGAVTWHH